MLGVPPQRGCGLALRAMSPSGSVRDLLYHAPNALDLAPDGIHVALMQGGPGGSATGGIEVVDLSTEDQRYLTPCPVTCMGTLDWSPDGTRIAFSDHGNIYLIDADGTHWMKLPTEPGAESPSWSPDGSRIAFSLAKDPASLYWGGPTDVYTIQVDGSNQVQLASCTHGCRWVPSHGRRTALGSPSPIATGSRRCHPMGAAGPISDKSAAPRCISRCAVLLTNWPGLRTGARSPSLAPLC